MKALSILQPWAWLICNPDKYERPKRVENRDWRAPPSFRGRFLVHAGKRHDKAQFHEALEMRPDLGTVLVEALARNELRFGGVVGAAELTDVRAIEADHIYVADDDPLYDDEWAFGPLCFVLRDARPLPFVPVKGALGFFDVDPVALGYGGDL